MEGDEIRRCQGGHSKDRGEFKKLFTKKRKWEGNLQKFIITFVFVGMMLGEGILCVLFTGHLPAWGPGSAAEPQVAALEFVLRWIVTGMLYIFLGLLFFVSISQKEGIPLASRTDRLMLQTMRTKGAG